MISLNIANMMSEVIGKNGLEESDIAGIGKNISDAHEAITRRRHKGLGFLDILDNGTKEIKDIASEIKAHSDTYFLLGIGGSALGPKCILEALSPLHNLRRSPKVFIYDNVDPFTLDNIMTLIDPAKTTVNVITKSGSTAETMASFMILYEKIKHVPKRFVATTDPVKSSLRDIAQKDGMRTLPIAPSVGGRYSVLTPVGLLIAEVIGADSDKILEGARHMKDRCADIDVWKNPAYLFGSLLYLMDVKKERRMNVLMPYSDRLRVLSEWFCQIWAESLGKQGKGLTPYPSIGTTDQHSQLQLWMEGPEDKVMVFIKVANHGVDMMIPSVLGDSETGYLGGKSLAGLLNAEEESTELCLSKAGRPSMTIELPRVDEYNLGSIFMFFEIATAFTGLLYNIDPFNQPSVEEGKNFTYGMMGRKGYESKKNEVEHERNRKSRWRI